MTGFIAEEFAASMASGAGETLASKIIKNNQNRDFSGKFTSKDKAVSEVERSFRKTNRILNEQYRPQNSTNNQENSVESQASAISGSGFEKQTVSLLGSMDRTLRQMNITLRNLSGDIGNQQVEQKARIQNPTGNEESEGSNLSENFKPIGQSLLAFGTLALLTAAIPVIKWVVDNWQDWKKKMGSWSDAIADDVTHNWAEGVKELFGSSTKDHALNKAASHTTSGYNNSERMASGADRSWVAPILTKRAKEEFDSKFPDKKNDKAAFQDYYAEYLRNNPDTQSVVGKNSKNSIFGALKDVISQESNGDPTYRKNKSGELIGNDTGLFQFNPANLKKFLSSPEFKKSGLSGVFDGLEIGSQEFKQKWNDVEASPGTGPSLRTAELDYHIGAMDVPILVEAHKIGINTDNQQVLAEILDMNNVAPQWTIDAMKDTMSQLNGIDQTTKEGQRKVLNLLHQNYQKYINGSSNAENVRAWTKRYDKEYKNLSEDLDQGNVSVPQTDDNTKLEQKASYNPQQDKTNQLLQQVVAKLGNQSPTVIQAPSQQKSSGSTPISIPSPETSRQQYQSYFDT